MIHHVDFRRSVLAHPCVSGVDYMCGFGHDRLPNGAFPALLSWVYQGAVGSAAPRMVVGVTSVPA